MEKYIKDMYNNLSYKEQSEIKRILEDKQHNIINDFKNTKDIENIDYSCNNFEYYISYWFKNIIAIFPAVINILYIFCIPKIIYYIMLFIFKYLLDF